MPGITGIISKTSFLRNKQALNDMIHTMLHESFYSCGTYTDDTCGVCVGWVCHKDSFCDCMPIWNEKKNVLLIYFGENFTDLDLFDQLKAKHHRFDNSNASYLVHLYEEKGPDFLQDLNGWFSGILIDMPENKIILFNDRYGMQKIFYHEKKDAFYFSSEAKALLKVCPELRTLDMKGVAELLSTGCVLENRSLYKDVFLLPTASAWTFQNDAMTKLKYFNHTDWENQTWLEKEFFYERLNETFKRILPRYFRSNQQIGISLTGGLDSRILLSNIEIPPTKYPCYTFGGMYRDCYDVKVARSVASALGQMHKTITVDDLFFKYFAEYAEKTIYITDGYLDVTGAQELYVNRHAKEIAPIRMTGNFGSEVLRDIRYLKPRNFANNAFHRNIHTHVDDSNKILQSYIKTFDNPLSFTLFAETPLHENNRLPCEQAELTVRTPYLDNDLVALMYRAPMGTRESVEFSLRLIADGNCKLFNIPTDRGYGGKLFFPLSTILHQYREFLFKAEYVYNYGMPHWLTKIDHFLKFLHLEKQFLGRHKYYHFRIWYRDELSEYIKIILLDQKTLRRAYLNKSVVENIVTNHTKGYRNYTTEISQLLTIELIQRLLIE